MGLSGGAADRHLARGAFQWLAKSQQDLVGMAANLGVKHRQRVSVGRVAKEIALRLEDEAGRLYLPNDRSRINPVQRVSIAKT